MTPLMTFTPSVGPKAGNTYNLPPYGQRPTRGRTGGGDEVAPEEADGIYVTAGTGTPFFGPGLFQVVFVFSNDWLLAAGYTEDLGGQETALIDFNQYVTEGGQGVWSDTPPSGTKYNGTVVGTRNFYGRIVDIQYDPLGDTVGELTVTLQNPSGLWTLLNGSGTTIGFVSFP